MIARKRAGSSVIPEHWRGPLRCPPLARTMAGLINPESSLNPSDRESDFRDPRFDLRVLPIGGLVTAALSVACATGFLHLSRSSTGSDVGPTAATLNDAFSTLFG